MIATQPVVDRNAVRYFLRGGVRPPEEPVLVVRHRGGNYLMDGHNFAVAAKLAGKQTIEALVTHQ